MSCPPNGMHERGHFNAPVITFVYFPPLSARLENALTSGRRKRSIASRLRSDTPFQHIPNAGPSLMIEGAGERDREEKTRKRHTYTRSRLPSWFLSISSSRWRPFILLLLCPSWDRGAFLIVPRPFYRFSEWEHYFPIKREGIMNQ